MPNKKGKGRKGKSKHNDPIASTPDLAQEITAAVDPTSSAPSGSSARPTPRDDDQLASPSTTSSLLPDHGSSPRGGDEINTPTWGEQASSSRTPSNHDARKGKQPMECLDSFPEDDDWLSSVHAARHILADKNCEKGVISKIKDICRPHFGKIESVQNLTVFVKTHRLVKGVKIFKGKMTILLATARGRVLAQAMVALMSECHLQNRSWNGTFDFGHIWIIEPANSVAFMMILNDTVSFERESQLQAMANDLDKTATILKKSFMEGDHDYPVHFEAFIGNLKNAKGGLDKNRLMFMEYLSYHPAIMPSTGRSTFISKLKSITSWSIMKLKPSAHLHDWRTVVASEIRSKKIRDKMKSEKIDKKKSHGDIISVLSTVYYHKNNYENTVHGLMRFMRNVLEHGMEHDDRVIHYYELELYLAKMFDEFLPDTLLAMLMSEKMEEFFGEDWSSYKISKLNYWEP